MLKTGVQIHTYHINLTNHFVFASLIFVLQFCIIFFFSIIDNQLHNTFYFHVCLLVFTYSLILSVFSHLYHIFFICSIFIHFYKCICFNMCDVCWSSFIYAIHFICFSYFCFTYQFVSISRNIKIT